MGLSTTVEMLLEFAITCKATDVHIEEGKSAYFRIGSDIISDRFFMTTEDIFSIMNTASTLVDWEGLCSYDGSITFHNQRIRVHFFKSRNNWAGTLRILYNEHVMLSESEEDVVLKTLCDTSEGLILVTGPTGSGKSYTLASCLNYLNSTKCFHIVTIEDPIEYMLETHSSLIHQRELGRDVLSMSQGIRDALREDPDVIMIGELRDRDTLEAAFHAAETGHLVFATMHAQRSIMAINRMISMFPPEQQEEVRSQLSQILKGVICQRLVYIENTYYALRDILLITPAVSNLIRQRKEPQIASIQETTKPMQTIEMAIEKLENQLGICLGLL